MRDGSESIDKITFLFAHVLTLHHKSDLTPLHLVAVAARVMSIELVNVPAANDACICWQIAAIALDEEAASEESVHFDVLCTCPNRR